MINPTFNSYSLQSEKIITKTVDFRNRAKRNLESKEIARRMGKKLVNSQIQEKVIELRGIILGDSTTDLTDQIDELQLQLSKEEKSLIIEGDRAYIATCERLQIPDRTYSQTMVEFTALFVASAGYAQGNQLTAVHLLPSGTNSQEINLTISGTVDNNPLITLTIPSGINPSPVNKIVIQNNATGNQLTVSGVWAPGDNIAIDYDNYQITKNGTIVDYVGAMDTLEPKENSLTVTVSGNNDGTKITLQHNPRYW